MSSVPASSRSKIPAGLAPMEGVTDFATRFWYQCVGGMDFTWTPFLRVTDTFPAKFPDLFAPELTTLKGLFPAPLIFQVMGSRPEDVIRTAEAAGDRLTFIDLNCGCPSPTVVGSRAGSSLLEHADQFAHFLETVATRLGPGRLSVKMRTGFHSPSEFSNLLAAIKHLPLRHLTVHGRTRPARYTGQADWLLIDEAVRTCTFPVFGSGDVCDHKTLSKRVETASGVKAVIIGRGALRNPWVFQCSRSAPLTSALAAFVLLQDLALESQERLVAWAAELSPDFFAFKDEARWMHLIETLLSSLRGQHHAAPLEDLQVSARALSRGKMLWNYLRSSLPEAYMNPALMRVTSLPQLLNGIDEITRQLQLSPVNVPVVYNPEHDWMYSGAGRKPSA